MIKLTRNSEQIRVNRGFADTLKKKWIKINRQLKKPLKFTEFTGILDEMNTLYDDDTVYKQINNTLNKNKTR